MKTSRSEGNTSTHVQVCIFDDALPLLAAGVVEWYEEEISSMKHTLRRLAEIEGRVSHPASPIRKKHKKKKKKKKKEDGDCEGAEDGDNVPQKENDAGEDAEERLIQDAVQVAEMKQRKMRDLQHRAERGVAGSKHPRLPIDAVAWDCFLEDHGIGEEASIGIIKKLAKSVSPQMGEIFEFKRCVFERTVKSVETGKYPRVGNQKASGKLSKHAKKAL